MVSFDLLPKATLIFRRPKDAEIPKYEVKGNAPHPGWGHLAAVTTTPEMEEGYFGSAVCNNEHTDAAAHVCSSRKHANPGWTFLCGLHVPPWRVLQWWAKKKSPIARDWQAHIPSTDHTLVLMFNSPSLSVTGCLGTWASFTASLNTDSLEFLRAPHWNEKQTLTLSSLSVGRLRFSFISTLADDCWNVFSAAFLSMEVLKCNLRWWLFLSVCRNQSTTIQRGAQIGERERHSSKRQNCFMSLFLQLFWWSLKKRGWVQQKSLWATGFNVSLSGWEWWCNSVHGCLWVHSVHTPPFF